MTAIVPLKKDDEILCAIDEVNEIYFAEEDIDKACEIVNTVQIELLESCIWSSDTPPVKG